MPEVPVPVRAAGDRAAGPSLGALAPWLAELARTWPWSPLPGGQGPIPARSRERVLIVVGAHHDAGSYVWLHTTWSGFLGPIEPPDGEQALIDHALACATAGHPLPTNLLPGHPDGGDAKAIRALVARGELASIIATGPRALLSRARGRRRPRAGFATEAVSTAAMVPASVPLALLGAGMRAATALAPDLGEVERPDHPDRGLLTDLLADWLPEYLANAAVRSVLLCLPVPLTVGLRTGQSSASVTVGQGRVRVVDGIAPEAIVVIEGEVEDLLRTASGSIAREASVVRIRPT